MQRIGWAIAVAAVAASLSADAPAGPASTSIDALLSGPLRLNASQVAAVRRGDAVATVLPSSLDREVAVAGAIRIHAPASQLVEVVRDVERLESGPGFLRTKKLSEPPRLEDFADLDLPSEDVKALQKCRPGRCDVKLGQGAFDLLTRIDWSAPDMRAQVNALARRTSLEYVAAYRQGGNDALALYRDSDRPQFIAHEFTDMVRRTSLLPGTMPGLADYLVGYPSAPHPDRLDEFFYWSMADFGLKPVLRINHVVIYPVEDPSGARFGIATKQLYASRYFHTALELRVAVDDPERPDTGHYLLTLNVARSDGLTGLFGGLVKSKVRSGSREGLERALRATRRLCETP